MKFLKFSDQYWELHNFAINEVIDKNLALDKKSIKCAIISNISDEEKFKLNQTMEYLNSNNINFNEDNSFVITISKIKSPQWVVYKYNVTVGEIGDFYANTLARPGLHSSFYQDAEQSLKIRVENYDYLGKYWGFIQPIIYILTIFFGIFFYYSITMNKELVGKPIHIKDFFWAIINEIKCIIHDISNISYHWVVGISLFTVPFSIYSFISSNDPQKYPPIPLLLIQYGGWVTKYFYIFLILIITFYLIFTNKGLRIETKKWLNGVGGNSHNPDYKDTRYEPNTREETLAKK